MAFVILTASTLLLYPLINLFYPPSKSNRAKKVYCVVMACLFVFFIGLRSRNIGIDSLDYSNSFYKAPKFSWDVFVGFLKQKEFLYHSLQSLVRTFTPYYTVWFCIVAIAYIVPLAIFIYRKSSLPYLSFILFMSMAYMNFAMAGLRQTFATSFLIISFGYLSEKKYIKYIIFVLIATCFHITACVFILCLFLKRDKIGIFDIAFFLLVFAFFVVFGRQLIETALTIVFKDTRSYTTDEYGGISTFALFMVIAVAALVFDKKITEKSIVRKDNQEALLFRLLLVAIPFQWLAIYQANCFRIAMYFSLFPILTIIPNTLSRQRDIVIKSVGTVLTLGLLLFQLFCITYHQSGVNPYEFFWEIA